jgi:hypothetical protein
VAYPPSAPPLRLVLLIAASVVLLHGWLASQLLPRAPHWVPGPTLQVVLVSAPPAAEPVAAAVSAPAGAEHTSPSRAFPERVQRPRKGPVQETEAPKAEALNKPLPQAPLAQAAPENVANQPAPGDVPLAGLRIPAPLRLRYEVTGTATTQTTDSQLLWRHDGSQYEARWDSGTQQGRRSQTSVGRIDSAGLAPIRYGERARSELAAHFDRAPEAARIRFSANTPDAALQVGAQDKLSVLLQLSALLAASPAAYPPGTTVALQTVGSREAADWVFTVAPLENLALPGGTLDTVKLRRGSNHDFDGQLEVWLAPSLGYLPVRLRLTQASGGFIDHQWAAAEKP